MGSDENAVQELRVSRSSRAVKGKRKVETKKARVKRRAVPERMRSERGVEEGTHRAGHYGTNGSRDNAGSQAGEAVALAAIAAPKISQVDLIPLSAQILWLAQRQSIRRQRSLLWLRFRRGSCCRYAICRAGKKHGFGYCPLNADRPARLEGPPYSPGLNSGSLLISAR
jgi:hypothetical protein